MPHIRRTLDELPTRFDGVMKRVRHGLGLTAFGAQAFDFPPGAAGPAHDEAGTGQEELYVGLSGAGWLEVDGERVELGPRVVVSVPAGTRRQIVAGPEGVSVLVVGGVPGRAYEVPERFRASSDDGPR